MLLSPAVKTALKYAILAVTVIAGLGPTVSELAGALPAQWISTLSHIVSVAGAVHLWLSESPLIQPLLQTKAPATVIRAAEVRAASIRPPASELPTQPELQGVVSSRPPPPNPPKSAA
jgi:hypothetical protein